MDCSKTLKVQRTWDFLNFSKSDKLVEMTHLMKLARIPIFIISWLSLTSYMWILTGCWSVVLCWGALCSFRAVTYLTISRPSGSTLPTGAFSSAANIPDGHKATSSKAMSPAYPCVGLSFWNQLGLVTTVIKSSLSSCFRSFLYFIPNTRLNTLSLDNSA